MTKSVFKPKEPVCLVRGLSLMPSYIYSIVCPLWLMKCYINSDTSNSLTFQAQGVRCLITRIDSHCQRFQMWKFFTSLVERFDRTIILKLKNMKFVLFFVATLSHIIDIRLIHCIVLCDIHMTFQLTINQTESVGFGNRFIYKNYTRTYRKSTYASLQNFVFWYILFYCAFFIGHFVKNDTSLQWQR